MEACLGTNSDIVVAKDSHAELMTTNGTVTKYKTK
jgi:hypothetical protein